MEVVNRLLGWKRGERAGPIKLHLVLTERCNLRCLSCFMGQIPQSASKFEVSDDRLRSLAHEAMDLGVQEFYLVGGEVFIRKEVTLDLMELIKRNGLFGDLTTNGTLLSERTVERIVAMGWDRLQVSIDGPDAATNDALRPPEGTFDRIIKGLTRLRDAKARHGVEHPRLTITTVLSNRNALALPRFVALAGELDAAEITFQSLKAMSDRVPELELDDGDKEKLQPAVEEAQRLAGRLGLLNNVGDFRQAPVVEHLGALDQTMVEDIHDVQDPFFGAHCFTPWTQMVVHVNGRVSPCWEWDAPDLGNVSDMKLADIWRGPVFERWREQFAAKNVPGFCAQCCLGFVDHTRYLRMKGLSLDGQYDEALTIADKILQHDPHHRDAVDTRARALYALGRYDEGASMIEQVVQDAPSGSGLLPSYLLHLLVDTERPELALEAAGRLLAGAKNNSEALRIFASLALGEEVDPTPLREGETKLGEQRRTATALAKSYVSALYDMGREEEARRVIRDVLGGLAGRDLGALSELMFEAHLRHEWEFVIELATGVLEREPDQVYSLWIRGAAKGKLGDLTGALADLDACVAGPGPARSHFNDAVHDSLAEVHLALGNVEECLRHAEEALNIDPDKLQCLEFKIHALFELGRDEEAESWIRTTLDSAPEHHLVGQGYLLLRLSERGFAESVLELGTDLLRRVVAGGQEGALRGLARAVLGESGEETGLVSLGQFGASVRGLVQALARSHYRLGQPRRARELVRRTLAKLEGPDLEVLSELLFEPHLAGEWATVVELATEVLQRQPDLAYARWIRGAARGKLGELEAARTDLEACMDAPAGWLASYADAVHDSLAEVHLHLSEPEEALHHAEEALRLDPKRTACLAIKDQALLALGRSDEGEDWIRTVLTESSPRTALGHAYLLLRLCERGAYDRVDELGALLMERVAGGEAGDGVAGLVQAVLGRDVDVPVAALGPQAASMRGLLQALVRAHHGQARREDAERVVARALAAVEGPDLEVLSELVFEHHAVDDWTTAVAEADALLLRQPDLVYARWVRGAAQGKLGELDAALADLRACLEGPADWLSRYADAVHDSLAEVHLLRSEPEEALRHAEEALRLDPKRTACLAIKDQALLALGRADEGEDWIRTVLTESSPHTALGHAYLLLRLCERGAYDRVDELGALLMERVEGGEAGAGVAGLVRAVLGRDVDAPVAALGPQAASMRGLLQARVRAHYGQARREDAEVVVRRALAAVDGPDIEVLSELVFEHHAVDEWATAEAAADALLERQPDLVYARWVRGAARGKLGELDAALGDLRACLEGPADWLSRYADAVHDSLAEVHLQRSEPEEALQHAEEALRLDPKRTACLAIKDQALLALGRSEEGEDWIRTVLTESSPHTALGHAYLLLRLCERGAYDRVDELGALLMARVERGEAGAGVAGLVRAVLGRDVDVPVAALGTQAASMRGLLQALVRAHYGRARREDAEVVVRRALAAVEGPDLEVLSELVFEHHAADEWATAVAAADTLLQRRPDLVYARWVRGAARGKLAELDAALEDLRACLDGPASWLSKYADAVHDSLAEVHLLRSEPEEALQHAEEALRLDPKRTACLAIKDQALLALGRSDEGEDWIRTVLTESSPHTALGHAYLLLRLCERGEYGLVDELGAGLLERIERGDAGPGVANLARAALGHTPLERSPAALGPHVASMRGLLQALMRSYHGQQHAGEARELARRVLASVDGPDLEVLSELIFEHHAQDEWAAAVELASEVLQRRPDLAYARWVRGAAQGKLGELDAALEDLRACLDGPASWLSKYADAVHDSLAEVHLLRDEPREALRHAEEALRLAPERTACLAIKDQALLALGRADEGDDWIRTVLTESSPGTALGHAYLLLRLCERGAHDRVEELGRVLAERIADGGAGPGAAGLARIALGHTEETTVAPLGQQAASMRGLLQALVRAHYGRGRPDEAGDLLRRTLVAVDGPDLEVLCELVFEPHLARERSTAVELANVVLGRRSDLTYVRWVRGAARGKLGELDAALEDLRATLDAPAQWLSRYADAVHDSLAEVHLLRSEPELALRHAEEALSLDPKRTACLAIKDQALLALGRADEGDDWIRTVLTESSTRTALGHAYLLLRLCDRGAHERVDELGPMLLERVAQGDTGAGPAGLARAVLGRTVEEPVAPLGPQAASMRGLLQALARTHYGLARLDAARDLVERALAAVEGSDLEVLCELLFEPHAADEWATAVKLADATLRRESDLFYALWVRGAARGKLGELDGARADLDACLGAPPAWLERHADAVHDALAEVHLEREQPDEALRHAELALRRSPSRAQSLNLKLLALQHMAQRAQRDGDADEALRLAAAMEALDDHRAAQMKTQVLLDAGFRAHARGDTDEALRLADEVLSADARAPKGLELRGLALIALGYRAHDRGDTDEALRLADEASSIDPERSQDLAIQVELAVGFEAHATGDIDRALQQADAVLALQPDHPEGLGLKAAGLMATGYRAHERGEAADALRRADQVLAIDDERGLELKIQALYTLAGDHLRQGEADFALQRADEALALDPGLAHVRSLRDRALLELRRLDEGEAGIRTVLAEASPRFALDQAHLLLGLCDGGRHRAALQLGTSLLRRLSDRGAGAAVAVLAGAVLSDTSPAERVALGDRDQAALSLVRALVRARLGLGHRRKAADLARCTLDAVAGEDLDSFSELITELHTAGEWDAVVSVASEVLSRRPDVAQARLARGVALGELGELDAALEDLEACQDTDQTWLQQRVGDMHDALAEVHLRREEPEEALRHAEQALSRSPSRAPSLKFKLMALQHLAYRAQRSGDADEALRLATAVEELDAQRAEQLKTQVLLDAGFRAHARGDSDEALRLSGEVLSVDARDPKGLELRGLALIALGYRAHDRGDADEALRLAQDAAPIDPSRSRELTIQVQLAVGFEAHASGDVDRALQQADAVLALQRDHPEGLGLKAAALMATGYRAHERGEALDALEQADQVMAIDGERGAELKVQALYTLAGDHLRKGEVDRALERADAALELDPGLVHVQSLRDRALLEMRRLDEGEAGIRAVLTETTPSFALDQAHLLFGLCETGRHRSALRLGTSLLERIVDGDAGEGLAELARAVAGEGERARGAPLGDRVHAALSLVRALLRARHGLGHRRKAIALAERALDAVADEDLSVFGELVSELHAVDEWAAAVDLAGDALSRRSDLFSAREVRGAALGKLGKLDEALADLDACLDAPEEWLDDHAGAVHDALAEVHMSREDPDEALRHAELALTRSPNRPRSLNLKLVSLQHLAYRAQQRGDAEEALRITSAVAALDSHRAAQLKTQVLLDAGFRAHARGDSEEALRLSDDVLAVDARDPKGLELRGLALIALGYRAHDRGDADEALRRADEAAAIDPLRSRELAVQVQLAVGFEAHAGGDADRALQQAETVLDLHPDHPEGLGLKAAALMATGYRAHEQGRAEDALHRAEQVLAIDGERGVELKVQALYTLAGDHLRRGEPDIALERADAALAIDPGLAQVQSLRDRALLALRRLDEGEAGIRAVLAETSPRFALDQAHLLLSLCESGRNGSALELGNRLLERVAQADSVGTAAALARAVLDGAPPIQRVVLGERVHAALALLRALARAHQGLGHPREAEALVRLALDAVADEALAVFCEIVFELHAADEWSAVVEVAGEALSRQPDLPYARWIRGAAQGKLGHLDAALTDLLGCLDAPPDWLENYADAVHDSLAEVYLLQGEPAQAVQHAERALAIRPERTETEKLLEAARGALAEATSTRPPRPRR